MSRISLTCVAGFISLGLLSSTTTAALVASYQFETGSTLTNSAGAATYRPHLAAPADPDQMPTHLATGGRLGTGAYSFDGAAHPDGDQLNFSGGGYLFFGYTPSYATNAEIGNRDYTFSFWFKTSVTGIHPNTANGGYDGSPAVPFFGSPAANGTQIGIDNGRTTVRYADPGWITHNGNTFVADGGPHYLTFVAHTNHTLLDIYVDGEIDVANIALTTPNAAMSVEKIGVTLGYLTGLVPHYGTFVLDDIRLYDEALSAATVAQLFSIPEPSGLALVGVFGVALARRKR